MAIFVGRVSFTSVLLYFEDLNVKNVISANHTCNAVLFVRIYEPYLGVSFRIIEYTKSLCPVPKTHTFSTVENFRCCLLTYIISNFQRIDEFWEARILCFLLRY